MKKIIIVNNNMNVGGVQKSLYNLLWTISGEYDITLYLFSPTGKYMDKLPDNVKIAESNSLFRYLGISQGQCAGKDKWTRGALALLCKAFGRSAVMKLLLLSQKTLLERYDCAIAYLQNGNIKNFYGGVQDFVLHRVKADKKVAFLHCDYGNCGADHPVNNRLIGEFDQIAACSDGCRRAFEKVMPALAEKCVTVRNCHRIDEIRQLADVDTVEYDPNYRNVVMVSRLAHEKGIERAIEAAACGSKKGLPIMLHIVGGGPMKPMLMQAVEEKGLRAQVCFYGEQSNPYRFMKNADLFLMTSYHEAAPMVIEEACCLGVPVLSVETTSSHEMITQRMCGWVCENSQQALNTSLTEVLSGMDSLRKMKDDLQRRPMDNAEASAQFIKLVEG